MGTRSLSFVDRITIGSGSVQGVGDKYTKKKLPKGVELITNCFFCNNKTNEAAFNEKRFIKVIEGKLYQTVCNCHTCFIPRGNKVPKGASCPIRPRLA